MLVTNALLSEVWKASDLSHMQPAPILLCYQLLLSEFRSYQEFATMMSKSVALTVVQTLGKLLLLMAIKFEYLNQLHLSITTVPM